MSEKLILKTENIIKRYPVAGEADFYALKDVSVEIYAHSLTLLKGKSGSGKTTLINMLSALDEPTEGKVFFYEDGKEICLSAIREGEKEKIRRTKMGFVFQSVSLVPMMNVYENVELSLRLSGFTGDRKARVNECLSLVGLSGRATHMPQELSGGEQQRVAIARAIAHSPEIIFADEPTAELDTATAHNVMKLFRTLVEKEGITLIMTTHDVTLMGEADKTIELSDGKVEN